MVEGSDSTTFNSNQKWNDQMMKHVNVNVKIIVSAKRLQLESQHMYLRIYLKSIADTLVIVFNEIINGADSVPTNVENIMPTNIANTISINVTSTALQ